MFTKSADFYDAIYSWKNYQQEASTLHNLISIHKESDGNALLDVACGTGEHIRYLKDKYKIDGLDLDAGMLAVARQKFPLTTFYEGNMTYFDLAQQYDVIICLFGSIGYVRTLQNMNRTLRTFVDHLKPGGIIVIEPWLHRENIVENTIHAKFYDQDDLKITRFNTMVIEGNESIMTFHYMVGRAGKVEYFTETHSMGLFSHQEYMSAFRAVNLEVVYDENGLMNRGLYIGINSD